MQSPSKTWLVAILTLSCCVWGLCVLGKPVHIDEANFLALTAGDWHRPHEVVINWQGKSQRAFDVLSNPPGIAWWLWPVRNQPIWLMRLWMMPWVFGALWGATRFGRATGQWLWPAALLVVSPIFVLSIGGLMPDMPLLACLLIGWGGYLNRRRSLFLVVLGCAVFFRYSALCFVGLFILTDLYRNRFDMRFLYRTLLVFVPMFLLLVLTSCATVRSISCTWLGFKRFTSLPRSISPSATFFYQCWRVALACYSCLVC